MLVGMAVLVLLLVSALGDNGSPQRSEKLRFALAQSAGAQTAPAGQIPTCQQILREFRSDARTQRASPEERQFVLAFVQEYVQRLLDQGVPGASRLDPDGNGIACDELQSAAGGQAASAGSASPQPAPLPSPQASPQPAPQPSVDRGSVLLNRNGSLLEAGGPTSGPVPLMPDGGCPREFPTMRDGACYPR